ncbi:MAG: hypothetical protein IKE55_10860 [Kiritimatiellae bacterium]|nr:hypothetical protein [Kiritimatiellia bacterium]
MAAAKRTKTALEFLLVKAELKGIPEKALLRSHNIGQVDLIWPRTGVAKKSGAREMVFKKGVCDFTGEPWAKRVVFREDVEGRCGIAVSITEPVSVQKVRRFLRLTAKYALKMGADFMEKAMVGYADIASSPIDALAAMIGEKDVPKVIARGVLDIEELPDEGEELSVSVPLVRPLTGRTIGTLVLRLR